MLLPQRSDTHLLSGVTRRHWEMYGKPLEIRSDNIDDLLLRVPEPEDVDAKSRSLLGALARRSKRPSDTIELSEEHDYPLAYAETGRELGYYIDHLLNLGFVTGTRTSDHRAHLALAPAGWNEARQVPRSASSKAFVAMWFDEQMRSVFEEAIEPSLRDDCGYDAVLIDQQEFLAGIVDEIMAEIRESRFIVADVTGQREGVYFEGGFAMGLGVPVVWTCNRADVDEKKLHFDTQHLNHIVWDAPEDLRDKLTNRVRATIGKGPLTPRSEQ